MKFREERFRLAVLALAVALAVDIGVYGYLLDSLCARYIFGFLMPPFRLELFFMVEKAHVNILRHSSNTPKTKFTVAGAIASSKL